MLLERKMITLDDQMIIFSKLSFMLHPDPLDVAESLKNGWNSKEPGHELKLNFENIND